MEFRENVDTTQKFDLSDPFIKDLQSSILLVYTGNTRESSRSLQDQVTKSEHGDAQTMENLNKIKNLALEMSKAISVHNRNEVCNIINDGWNIKKSLGTNVTNQRIDEIISYAKENGAKSAKLLGGGSEGFILLIGEKGGIDSLQRKMMVKSDFVIRVRFDNCGTRVINNYIEAEKKE